MKRDYHHWIYLALLTLFVIFLPTSKYLTSATQIALLLHWLVRNGLAQRIRNGLKNRALMFFLVLYLGHVVGMIYTHDWNYGLHDLKIKLPLLVLPIIIGTSEELNFRELKWILLFFVAAVFASSLISVGVLLEWIDVPTHDFREASLFISHIRFALLVDMALFILTFYAWRRNTPIIFRLIWLGFAGYFLGYLILSKSLTGLVVAFVVGLILSVRWAFQQTSLSVRRIVLVGVLSVPVLLSVYIGKEYKDFYTLMDSPNELITHTIQGNIYWHDSTNLSLENGYRVGFYWCEKEMREAWPEKSEFAYDGKDEKGQDLKYTLIRYLTSRGLKKDAEGIQQLSAEDVKLIEQGYSNYIYLKPSRFHNRVYETIWEIDRYRKGGNPSGHSVTQRLEYLKTGWAIVRDHWLWGVGTGDVLEAYQQKYAEQDSCLQTKWQLRAHNQWLSFAVALGVVGMVTMFLAFTLPGIVQKRFSNYLFLLLFAVAFLSMLNEDTLETQAGVAFVAFFYPLFLFAIPHEDEI